MGYLPSSILFNPQPLSYTSHSKKNAYTYCDYFFIYNKNVRLVYLLWRWQPVDVIFIVVSAGAKPHSQHKVLPITLLHIIIIIRENENKIKICVAAGWRYNFVYRRLNTIQTSHWLNIDREESTSPLNIMCVWIVCLYFLRRSLHIYDQLLC